MERDMNYDLELARYIWSILKSDLPVLMSWGVEIETVKVITCGIEFKVNGFKHTGRGKTSTLTCLFLRWMNLWRKPTIMKRGLLKHIIL